MPDEKDRYQSDRHGEARYTICDLRELFAFFKEMSNADVAAQAAVDRMMSGVQTNTAEIAAAAKP